MTAKILAATLLVLLVATLCTLLYASADAARWALRRCTARLPRAGNRP